MFMDLQKDKTPAMLTALSLADPRKAKPTKYGKGTRVSARVDQDRRR